VKNLYAGFDIGSSSIHCAVVGQSGAPFLLLPSRAHLGNPRECLREQWETLLGHCPPESLSSIAFTGIGSRGLRNLFPEAVCETESVTLPQGAACASPGIRFLFHIGARDSFFFRLASIQGETVVTEWAANTKCGGGSGTLLEKQVLRLYGKEGQRPGEDVRARMARLFGEAASEAAGHPDAGAYNARCGIIIQSDLIHDQNEGLSRPLILSRLLATLLRNFKNDVVGSTWLDGGPAAVSGGVFSFPGLAERLESLLQVPLVRPPWFLHAAAIGAAFISLKRGNRFLPEFARIEEGLSSSAGERGCAPSLSESLSKVFIVAPLRREGENLPTDCPVDVTLGVDGGSTTTKAAVLDARSHAVLDSLYIPTHGDPEGALKSVLRHLAGNAGRYRVLAVCATGSARKLYERILTSPSRRAALEAEGFTVPDGTVDEITCHARGVKEFDPAVDTIFEIGGQDMKFTTFRRRNGQATGEVQEARMNYSCQAGAGQTLENMAALLGLDVKTTLQEAALSARRVPVIDATCGVFMEMDEKRLIAEGVPVEEIAAAVVRATVAGYFHKFVGGSRSVGTRCSCQGGPSLGKAVLAALGQVTGKEIFAYPGRELFGAIGAALCALDAVRKAEASGHRTQSAFRGWQVADSTFGNETVSCSSLFGSRSCGRRDCKLRVYHIEGETITTGGFCPRGNTEATGVPRPDYVEIYHRLLERHFPGTVASRGKPLRDDGRPTVGIKRSGETMGEWGVWCAAVLDALGFHPVLSPVSDERIVDRGIQLARTDLCFAMKLSLGHSDFLANEAGVDFLFHPAFIHHCARRGTLRLKYCVYTEGEGFLSTETLGLPQDRVLAPIWKFGNPDETARVLQAELARIGSWAPLGKVLEAFGKADSARAAYREALAAAGEGFLRRVAQGGQPGYVGLGREYVLCDPAASSDTGRLFSRVRGMDYIPMAFLWKATRDIPIHDLVDNEYWVNNAEILKASLFVAKTPGLYPIRQMNFACGPDSIKFFMEREIFERAEKPFLHLVTDAQTNNAPFATRAEAHERVVAQASPKTAGSFAELLPKRPAPFEGRNRTWLIASMGPVNRLGASLLRHWGIRTAAVPTAGPSAREWARRTIPVETCFPLKGVTGDILAFLEEESGKVGRQAVMDRYAVFLPRASGPCRLGKYDEVLRQCLAQAGFPGLPVSGPHNGQNYRDIPFMPAPVEGKPAALFRFTREVIHTLLFSDFLDDLCLRLRPYAPDPQRFQDGFESVLERVADAIEEEGLSEPALKSRIRQSLDSLLPLSRPDRPRFPLVLFIGEIYMRLHDPYTDHAIRRLESEGLEVIRSGIGEWLEYMSAMTRRDGPNLSNLLAGAAFAFSRNRFAMLGGNPFPERRRIPDPVEAIGNLERERLFTKEIGGESPINIGIFNEFMNGRITPSESLPVCGIFHCGPFTCMHETLAASVMAALSKNRRASSPDTLLPILHANFGDSPNPNLEAEIAAFREACHARARLERTAALHS
jgi:activator of 2-hydroxyglutaryl-CoA dehydratase/predicted nucleotide-binding protein (sugar kinase/HSP70/actin superfamily)